MGEGVFIIDITEANRLLEEQRRVIQEVARRCLFKGKNHLCLGCLGWDCCQAQHFNWEEMSYACHR
jgi:hypothetical protein